MLLARPLHKKGAGCLGYHRISNLDCQETREAMDPVDCVVVSCADSEGSHPDLQEINDGGRRVEYIAYPCSRGTQDGHAGSVHVESSCAVGFVIS